MVDRLMSSISHSNIRVDILLLVRLTYHELLVASNLKS